MEHSLVIGPDAPADGSQRFQGAIFDVDGVLVDSPHYRAWRDALQELMDTEWTDLRARTGYSPEKFTEAGYQQVVAGRPRLAGARAAMDYFGVPDTGCRAELYAAVKQEHLVTLMEAGEFTAFADAIRFVLATNKGLMENHADPLVIFGITGTVTSLTPPVRPHRGAPRRGHAVAVEKPFGHDLASARDLKARLHRPLRESQMPRVDHFLAKEPVIELKYLRFANLALAEWLSSQDPAVRKRGPAAGSIYVSG